MVKEQKEFEIEINDTILTLKSKSSYDRRPNSDSLESESSTVQLMAYAY